MKSINNKKKYFGIQTFIFIILFLSLFLGAGKSVEAFAPIRLNPNPVWCTGPLPYSKIISRYDRKCESSDWLGRCEDYSFYFDLGTPVSNVNIYDVYNRQVSSYSTNGWNWKYSDTRSVDGSWSSMNWGSAVPHQYFKATLQNVSTNDIQMQYFTGTYTGTYDCSVPPPVCTSFTYSAWSTCSFNGSSWLQTRSILTSLPSGCYGGSPVTVQSCLPPPPNPVVYLTANPTSVYSGNSTTLLATVSNSSWCTLTGNGNTFGWNTGGLSTWTSGILTLSTGPIATFTLDCYNSIGVHAYDYATISILPIIPITVNIDANPNPVLKGKSSTISWSSTGADSCSITKGTTPLPSGTGTSSLGISSGSISETTNFIATCTNITTSVNSSKLVEVSPPDARIYVLPSEIIWEVNNVESCFITKNGEVWQTGLLESGNITSDYILAGDTYELVCEVNGQEVASDSEVSVAPAIRSICTPSQNYINRNTTWTVNLTNASGATITNRVWNGTDVPQTSGLTVDKIYTTVGTKTMNATTTGTRADDSPFVSTCSTTTIMKLDSGSSGEI